MPDFIENPIKNNEWDPSKGDFYSDKTDSRRSAIHWQTKKKEIPHLFSRIYSYCLFNVLFFFCSSKISIPPLIF